MFDYLFDDELSWKERLGALLLHPVALVATLLTAAFHIPLFLWSEKCDAVALAKNHPGLVYFRQSIWQSVKRELHWIFIKRYSAIVQWRA